MERAQFLAIKKKRNLKLSMMAAKTKCTTSDRKRQAKKWMRQCHLWLKITNRCCCFCICFQAHKVVLSASSPFFKSMLRNNPAQHPVLIMPPEVKYQDLERVFEFIYCGVVKVQSIDVESFMRVANLLKIRGLTEQNGGPAAAAEPKQSTSSNSDKPPSGWLNVSLFST